MIDTIGSETNESKLKQEAGTYELFSDLVFVALMSAISDRRGKEEINNTEFMVYVAFIFYFWKIQHYWTAQRHLTSWACRIPYLVVFVTMPCICFGLLFERQYAAGTFTIFVIAMDYKTAVFRLVQSYPNPFNSLVRLFFMGIILVVAIVQVIFQMDLTALQIIAIGFNFLVDMVAPDTHFSSAEYHCDRFDAIFMIMMGESFILCTLFEIEDVYATMDLVLSVFIGVVTLALYYVFQFPLGKYDEVETLIYNQGGRVEHIFEFCIQMETCGVFGFAASLGHSAMQAKYGNSALAGPIWQTLWFSIAWSIFWSSMARCVIICLKPATARDTCSNMCYLSMMFVMIGIAVILSYFEPKVLFDGADNVLEEIFGEEEKFELEKYSTPSQLVALGYMCFLVCFSAIDNATSNDHEENLDDYTAKI